MFMRSEPRDHPLPRGDNSAPLHRGYSLVPPAKTVREPNRRRRRQTVRSRAVRSRIRGQPGAAEFEANPETVLSHPRSVTRAFQEWGWFYYRVRVDWRACEGRGRREGTRLSTRVKILTSVSTAGDNRRHCLGTFDFDLNFKCGRPNCPEYVKSIQFWPIRRNVQQRTVSDNVASIIPKVDEVPRK